MKTFADVFTRQVGDESSITGFSPDSLVFNFSSKITRRVAVKPDVSLSFEKQYDSVGAMHLHPDSVDVSGPGSVVSGITFISTQHIALEHVKDPVSKKVKLVTSKLLELSDSSVMLQVPVEKFTEENLEIPVKPIHVRQGYSLKTFPDKITIRYLVALSKYNAVTPGLFDAVVYAEKLTDENSSKVKVELLTVPSFVKVVAAEPQRVDYILHRQ